jgi:hypothetical protein
VTYGFVESFQDDVRFIGHSGAIRGFGSSLNLLPAHDMGFFFSFNEECYQTQACQIIRDFREEFLAYFFPLAKIMRRKQMQSYLKLAALIIIFVFLGSCSTPAIEPMQTAIPITPELPTPTSDPVKKVLFIGNSYTFSNNLPEIFGKLMIAGGHEVEVTQSTFGGWSLSNHAMANETLDQITANDWDYVILQEQSAVTNP